MTAPPASVLIPARNAAGTIGSALRSVQAQTLREWEAVVVDDGSTDGTTAIVAESARLDPRIRLIKRAALGIVSALNAGLSECRAALIARFDADDLMHKYRLERQVAMLAERPELSGVSSLVRCFPRRTLRDGMRRYEGWLNSLMEPEEIARSRFVESPMVHPSVTIRREVLVESGSWRDVDWAEDWDLWLRLLEKGHRFAKVPAVLHFWRDTPDRLTRTQPRYSAERLVEARAIFLRNGPLAGRKTVIWGAGPVGKALAKALLRAGVEFEAFIDVDPRKIGQLVYSRRVLGPASVAKHRPCVLLGAVGAAGARDEIRAAAKLAGYSEGVDFFACA